MTNSSSNVYLSVMNGENAGKRYRLNCSVVSLVDNELRPATVLTAEDNSQFDAQIRHDNGVFRLIDPKTSTEIFVNDFRVDETTLNHGDRIRIGKTIFLFENENVETNQYSRPAENLDPSDQVSAHDKKIPLSKRLDVFCNISRAISETKNLDELLSKILTVVFEWTDADRGCILLANESEENFEVVAGIDRDGKNVKPIKISKSLIGHAKKTRQPVVIKNLPEDNRWDSSKSLKMSGIQEAICVPINYRDNLSGFIYFDSLYDFRREPKPIFNEEHVKLMSAIGQQAAVAVENHIFYSRLLESNRMAAVGEAISSLSHHIKNILQGISGGAHIIEDGLKTENVGLASQGWDIVRRNQDKITQLVLDMVSFSDHELDLRLTDLNLVITHVVTKLNAEIDPNRIRIDWHPSPQNKKVLIDRKLISRAVENLIENAIDACQLKTDGLITVRAAQSDECRETRISVSDNGCGIAEANLNKVFSLFESSKGDRATGIGLAVTQKFIREHNGEVFVKSQLNHGSEFTIVFPSFYDEQSATSPLKGMHKDPSPLGETESTE